MSARPAPKYRTGEDPESLSARRAEYERLEADYLRRAESAAGTLKTSLLHGAESARRCIAAVDEKLACARAGVAWKPSRRRGGVAWR